MGSAPGATIIRKCGTQHYGADFKTRTIPVFTCSNFQPNYSKSTQGNQKRFPEDLAGFHRNTHQEIPLDLCDGGCTITLDKQDISIQKNGEETFKGNRNKKTEIWEVSLGTKQSENVVHNILAQTSKPELSQYLHAALLRPTIESLLKEIKIVFLKTWPGLTEKLIKKHLEKSRNATIGHLHTRLQGLQSTKETTPDKTNLLFCTTGYPSTTK